MYYAYHTHTGTCKEHRSKKVEQILIPIGTPGLLSAFEYSSAYGSFSTTISHSLNLRLLDLWETHHSVEMCS